MKKKKLTEPGDFIGTTTMGMLQNANRSSNEHRHIVSKISQGLRRLAEIQMKGLVSRKEEPDDIAHAVIATMLGEENHRAFASRQDFNRWCNTLIKRHLISRYRYYTSRKRGAGKSEESLRSNDAVTNDDPSAGLLNAEAVARGSELVNAFKELCAQDRDLGQIAYQSTLLGMSGSQLAAEWKISKSTANARIREAKEWILRKLKDSGLWEEL